MLRVIVFDDGKGSLAPLADLRASFDIRTGALTALERLTRVLGQKPGSLWVPQAMTALVRAAHALPVNGTLNLDGPSLLYNGRCPLPPQGLASMSPGDLWLEAGSGDLVCACLSPRDASAVLAGARPEGARIRELPAPTLLSRPWHARTFRDRCIDLDLRLITSADSLHPDADSRELFEQPADFAPPSESGPGPIRIPGFPISVARGARVHPGAILDAEHGPIVIAERAVVRPGAIIIGPVFIGPCSTVLERATIRPYTGVGPWCKVNGEIGGCIFQGYSNKAHDGYLGDAWVGEWVNLGAGTTCSNLLNTYAEIPAVTFPGGGHERTGETFLGPTIGDHVKTAICTRLMTGSVLHTGGMFACTAPVTGCTRPFCWRTDAGERSYRLDKFLDVARAMMARRKVEPSQAYLERLASLHQRAV